MNLYKELRKTAIPIIIQNFMLALVTVSDALMLGRWAPNAMSAVNLAGQIQFILNMFVSGISGGMGVMVAQYWGKKNGKTIERIVPIALRLNVAIGVVFSVVGLIFARNIMHIFTDDVELLNYGREYILTVAPSYLICGISQIYLVLLKNTGHAKTSSVISSVAVVANIVLNAIFIFGFFGLIPGLGIRGAALATVSARIIELVLAVIFSSKKDRVKVKWNRFFESAGKELNSDFWRYSVPVLAAALVWGFAFSSYSSVMGHMGNDAMAAFAVVGSVKQVVTSVSLGLSAATGIILGNVLGSGDTDTAKKWGNKMFFVSFLVGASIFAVMLLLSFILPPVLPHFMELTGTSVYYLRFMLIIMGVNLWAMSINTVLLDGIACAGGDSAFDMKGNLVFMWCFGVPLSFMACFLFSWPVLPVFICTLLDEVVKMPLMIRHHYKYVWLRNITRDDL